MLFPRSGAALSSGMLFCALALVGCDPDMSGSMLVTDASPATESDGGDRDGGTLLNDGGDGVDASVSTDASVSADGGLDGGMEDGGSTSEDGGFTPVDGGGELDGSAPDASLDGSAPELDGAVIGDAGGDEPDAAPPGPRCGDGHLDEHEDCDDANEQSWDGCSSDCRIEKVAWIARVNTAGPDRDVVLATAAEGSVIVSVNTTLDGAEAIATRTPYVVGLDARGAESLRVELGLSGSSYFHFDAHAVADGSLRIVAQFDGTVRLSSVAALTAPSGRRSAFIASYDGTGDLQWVHELRHETTRDAPSLAWVRVLPDGELVAAGAFARAEPIEIGDAVTLAAPVASGAGVPRALYMLRVDERGVLIGSAGFVASTPAANSVLDIADVLALDGQQTLVLSGVANTRYTFAGGTSEERVVTAAALAATFDRRGALTWSVPYTKTFLRGGSRLLSSGLLALLGRNGGANETLFVTTEGTLRMQKRGSVIGEGSDSVVRLGSGYTGTTFNADGHPLSSPLSGITRYAIAYTPQGGYVWAHNLVSTSATGLAAQPPSSFADGSFVGAGECPELVGEGLHAEMPTADLCVARFDANGVLAWNRELTGTFALASLAPPYKPSVAVTAQGETWMLLESTATWSFAAERTDLEAGGYFVQLAPDGALTRLLRAGSTGLSVAAPLLTVDNSVVAAFQHADGEQLFAGDPAESTLSLDPGDTNGLVVMELRP